MYRKFAILAAVLSLWLAQLACGPDEPKENPLTSPVTEVEQIIMDVIQPNQQNTLSNP